MPGSGRVAAIEETAQYTASSAASLRLVKRPPSTSGSCRLTRSSSPISSGLAILRGLIFWRPAQSTRLENLPRFATASATASPSASKSLASQATVSTPSGASCSSRSSRLAMAVTANFGASRSATARPIPLDAPTISACPRAAASSISGDRRAGECDQIVGGFRLADAVQIGVGADLLEQVDDREHSQRIPHGRLVERLTRAKRRLGLDRVGQLAEELIDGHALLHSPRTPAARRFCRSRRRKRPRTGRSRIRRRPKPAAARYRRRSG